MNNTWSIDELQHVWHLASRKHDGQKYGGEGEGEQVEYLNHIGSVAFEIIAASMQDKNMDAGLAIKCALLHDTIEDTDLTYEVIEQQHGTAVAKGVLALTKNASIESKQEKMIDSLQRIKQQPKEVWAVKLADRIVNLYAPPFYWNNEKRKEYQQEAKLILKELGEGNAYLADRLSKKIEAYNRFIK